VEVAAVRAPLLCISPLHTQKSRRLEEIGGIKPLAFGQFGEMGPGLEALLASTHGETRGG
jgi:hypothetical protein